MALTVASTLQLGPTWVSQYAIIMSMAGFYAAQWEECVLPAVSKASCAHSSFWLFRYHTGVLELGYFNVTEAQLMTIALYLATGLLGPSVWLQTVNVMGHTIQLNHLFITGATLLMLYNILSR